MRKENVSGHFAAALPAGVARILKQLWINRIAPGCSPSELLRGRRGDVIYLPKGIPHAPRVIGNDEGAAVVVCVPGGFDRFFAACAEEFKRGEPEMPLKQGGRAGKPRLLRYVLGE